jgi:tetratricopeptide (TPR) repeat protein
MKKYSILTAVILFFHCAIAQVPYNAMLPNGYTKKAMVSEQVGLTEVTITYHRPAVKGREGKIWGQTVHAGFTDQGFGTSKAAPWRAGANENTIIEFDKDVKVEGQPLPKGRYGLFIAYDPEACIVIFSKRTDGWGSFFYNEKEDALRVKVKPRPIDKTVEQLKYEFTEQSPNSATILLSWEKLSIPFKIEVDHLRQQFDAFVTEAQNPRGFTPQGLNVAANWALQNNYQLEKGLEWAALASGTAFPGDPTSFPALTTRSLLLIKLGRSEEATAVIKTALPYGSVNQLQQLGRQLISLKQPKAAMEVFQYSYNKSPDLFPSLAGMARGLSANGEYPKAAEFASKALAVAPNEASKEAINAMILKLREGKDINQ